jgi:maltose O-acetyltransferase
MKFSSSLKEKLRDILVFYGIEKRRQNSRLKWLVKNGMKLGANCYIAPSVLIDNEFPWLISIGNDCAITENCNILAHDASTLKYLGYSKIGAVTIGNKCYVGTGSVILPNVHIGDNVIIGSGSIVTRDVPSDSVVAGNPAKVITTLQSFLDLHSSNLRTHPVYKKKGWALNYGITEENKKIMLSSVKDKIGYVE